MKINKSKLIIFGFSALSMILLMAAAIMFVSLFSSCSKENTYNKRLKNNTWYVESLEYTLYSNGTQSDHELIVYIKEESPILFYNSTGLVITTTPTLQETTEFVWSTDGTKVNYSEPGINIEFDIMENKPKRQVWLGSVIDGLDTETFKWTFTR